MFENLLNASTFSEWEFHWNVISSASETSTLDISYSISEEEDCEIIKCPAPVVPSDAFAKVIRDGHEKYVCTHQNCGREFVKKSKNTRAHYLTHLNIRPFQCRECNATFTRRLDCKRHCQTHKRKLSAQHSPLVSLCI